MPPKLPITETVGSSIEPETESGVSTVRLYPDQVVATSLDPSRPDLLDEVEVALVEGPPDDQLFLSEDNPLVISTAEMLEKEAAQFGDKAQILIEAATNGAEASPKDGKRVRVDITLTKDEMRVKDNGKGMKFGKHLLGQVIKPNSGDTNKRRGRFGQGTKAYWELLEDTDPNSRIILRSKSEDGGDFTVSMGREINDDETKKGRRFLDASIGTEASPVDFDAIDEHGTEVVFANHSIPEEEIPIVMARLMDDLKGVYYADIYLSDGENTIFVNESMANAESMDSGEVTLSFVGPDWRENVTSTTPVEINIAGDNIWSSDLSGGDGDNKIVLNFPSSTMRSEARSLAHFSLRESDLVSVIELINDVSNDTTLDVSQKVVTLAALSRAVGQLQKRHGNPDFLLDLNRNLAAKLNDAISETDMTVFPAFSGVEDLVFDQSTILVDEDIHGFLPAEKQFGGVETARGYDSHDKSETMLIVEFEGEHAEEIFLQRGDYIFVNANIYKTEDSESLTPEEWTLRANILNEAITLWNDIGVGQRSINGRFDIWDMNKGKSIRATQMTIWPSWTKSDVVTTSESTVVVDVSGEPINPNEPPMMDNPEAIESFRDRERQIREIIADEPITLEQMLPELRSEIIKEMLMSQEGSTYEMQVAVLNMFFEGGEEIDSFILQSTSLNDDRLEYPEQRATYKIADIYKKLSDHPEFMRIFSHNPNLLAKMLAVEPKVLIDELLLNGKKSFFSEEVERLGLSNEVVLGEIKILRDLFSDLDPSLVDAFKKQLLFENGGEATTKALLYHNLLLADQNLQKIAIRKIAQNEVDFSNSDLIRAKFRAQLWKTLPYPFNGRQGVIGYPGKETISLVRNYVEYLDIIAEQIIVHESEQISLKIEDVYSRDNEINSRLSRIGTVVNRMEPDEFAYPWAFERIRSVSKVFDSEKGQRLPDFLIKIQEVYGREIFSEWNSLETVVPELQELIELDAVKKEKIDLLDDYSERLVSTIPEEQLRDFGSRPRVYLKMKLAKYMSLPIGQMKKELDYLMQDVTDREVNLSNIIDLVNVDTVGSHEHIENRQKLFERYPHARVLYYQLVESFPIPRKLYIESPRQRLILDVVEYLTYQNPEEEWDGEIYKLEYHENNELGVRMRTRSGPRFISTGRLNVYKYLHQEVNESPENLWFEEGSFHTSNLIAQHALYFKMKAEDEDLSKYSAEQIERMTEELRLNPAQVESYRRRLEAAITTQDANKFRFWREWRQNSQNAKVTSPKNERVGLVSQGLDKYGRRYAKLVDFGGMTTEEAIWNLGGSPGFKEGEANEGSLEKFHMGWLTCLNHASEVRVVTSTGNGIVTYRQYIPVFEEDPDSGSRILVDVYVRTRVDEDPTVSEGITDMTWYGEPGIDSWIDGEPLESEIRESSLYLTEDEFTLYMLGRSTFGSVSSSDLENMSIPSILEMREQVFNNESSRSFWFGEYGNKIKLDPLNQPQEVLVSKNDEWQLRALRKDNGGKLIQAGFAVGQELPAQISELLPSVFKHILDTSKITPGLAIPKNIPLNKARDRITDIEKFSKENADRITTFGVESIAYMLARGALNEQYLAYDFQRKFLQRHTFNKQRQIDAVMTMSQGDIPDLRWLRDSDDQSRETMIMALNLPFIQLQGTDEKYSIMELMVINAGANYLLNQRVKEHDSVHMIIDPMIVEKEGEFFLSQQAVDLIKQNSELASKISNRLEFVQGQIGGVIPEATKELGKRIKAKAKHIGLNVIPKVGVVAAAAGTVGGVVQKLISTPAAQQAIQSATVTSSEQFAAQSLILSTSVLVAAGAGLMAFRKTQSTALVSAGSGGGRVSFRKNNRRNSKRKQLNDQQTTKDSKGEEIAEIKDRDLSRVLKLKDKGSLEDSLKAAKLAQRTETRKVLPFRYMDETIDGSGTSQYRAFTVFVAEAVKIMYPEVDFSPNDVGFYYEDGGVLSLARGGGNTIGFNLEAQTLRQAMKAFEDGDVNKMIHVLSVTAHESAHAEQSGWHPGIVDQDTHDRGFNQMVYRNFSRLMLRMMRGDEQQNNILRRTFHDAQTGVITGEPIKPGREFYSVL